MGSIYYMDIRKLDLNLLVMLDVLVAEGSVTRAAKRVHLSQSAMSSALNRLRQALDDPLLVRAERGMEPTRKARELIGPVREALARIESVISPPMPADVESVERTFVIAASEYVSFVVVPALSRELERLGPRLSLSVVRLDPNDPLAPLHSGAVDLVIAAHASERPNIHSHILLSDKYVCIARKRHATIRGRLSMAQFVASSHVVIRHQTGGIGGIVDDLFLLMGKPRKTAITLPDLSAGPHIVMETEFIMATANRIAISLRKQFPIQILAHPVRRDQFEVSQFWHQRTHTDAMHRWFRETIHRVCKELDSKPSQRRPTHRSTK
jgi:DNA-binding transcriptional LysR family regulator